MFTFKLSIIVSAFLLFQVQLIIARCILPWFGGSAAVWMVCMLFFQLLLVAGYGYSHLLVHRIDSRRTQAGIHIGLLVLSCAVLIWQKVNWGHPLLPAAGLRPESGAGAVLSILHILTVSVGLPFLALSSTSSLLQAWFVRIWENHSPYVLYALSNAGSMLGLLCYPLLITPFIGLQRQSLLWFSGFIWFAGSCIAAALIYLRKGSGSLAGEPDKDDASSGDRPGLIQKMLWILLPAAGAVLMMATTNVLTQDIAVIPLLWVLPLALYLLSYIVAFSGWNLFTYNNFYWFLAALVGLYGLLYVALLPVSYLPTAKIAAPYLFAMFVACVYCHGSLVQIRPAPRHLTGFYLSLSIGGALGGLFVAILAPLLFTTVAELAVGYVASAGLVILVIITDPDSLLHGKHRWVWRGVAVFFITALGAGLNYYRFSDDRHVIARTRNFYGSLMVWRDEIIHSKTGMTQPVQFISHGETTHGLQVIHPNSDHIPMSYYGVKSGMGLLLECCRKDKMKVGGVGLGIGTLATYGRAGDEYRFYEIDESIVRLATDPAVGFTYLSKARAGMEIILGDARLNLERELEQGGNAFDILVLDAFTGDAVPEHLLTREAFEIYAKHLRPGGAIAVHISSRHFDLSPVIFRMAESMGMEALLYDVEHTDSITQFSNTWMILSESSELIAQLTGIRKPTACSSEYDTVPLWTDDFSNMLQLIKINERRPFL